MNEESGAYAPEKRKNPRVAQEAAVSAEIISAPESPALEGKTFSANSRDISLGGIQIYVDLPVPVDTELLLRVTFEHTSETFEHKGFVMWVHERQDSGASGYVMGVHLKMEDNQQFRQWRTAVYELLKNINNPV